MSQLTLDVRACKAAGCDEPVVVHSITGRGHVCRRHNVAEWGAALARSEFDDYRRLGERLLEDAA